jgi:prepilin-type N-terminal cleavage/methylation domain-containing protein
MKRTNNINATKATRGFTLVELLTVIFIIATLMGMMTTALRAARKRAQITKASAEVRELTKAWKGYWVTYGEFPFGSGSSIKQPMNAAAMAHLTAFDVTHNEQGIVFMERDPGPFLDPWDNVYIVDLDRSDSEGVDYYESCVYFPQSHRYDVGAK